MTPNRNATRTGLVMDMQFLQHDTGTGHPENAGRLEAVYNMLETCEYRPHCRLLSPQPCSENDLAQVHARGYIAKVAATATRPYGALGADTPVSAQSYRAARLAAGGTLQAIREVWSGRLVNALALVRPPGHHAENARAMGFCLFNNVAVGAVFARQTLGVRRVLIVDWDVHHGNGTQHAFERDPQVLFFSSHQHPHYPGTGLYTETGLGRGEGFTVNLPLTKGGYGDNEFAALYQRILQPLALEFDPDLILVSAGFDIHAQDPLGRMRVTAHGFAALTRLLMDIAARCCGGKLVLVLEGGYRRAALKASVRSVLGELTDQSHTDFQTLAHQADRRKVDYVFHRCAMVHRRFWHCFAD
jgi:acetoin utilization deacetylase AcuC-like enzyme